MGDVVDFFRTKDKPQTPYDAFEESYREHYEVVCALTNSVIAELADRVDIETAHPYDTFMLRESIMSLVMRQKNTYHPLQEFTQEFVSTFGDDEPKES
jgi:hypothetical protein